MNREELIKLLQSWLTTATDDNGNPIHVIMDVDIHEIATEIIKSSLPPAEGAEEILQKTTLSDTSVPNVPLSWLIAPESPTWNAVIAAMHEFAAQQQPTAEGAEEILEREFPLAIIDEDEWTGGVLKIMREFATLHAQRLAEKIVEERLREELMAYDKFLSNTYWGVSHLVKRDEAVDEYLKSREK